MALQRTLLLLLLAVVLSCSSVGVHVLASVALEDEGRPVSVGADDFDDSAAFHRSHSATHIDEPADTLMLHDVDGDVTELVPDSWEHGVNLYTSPAYCKDMCCGEPGLEIRAGCLEQTWGFSRWNGKSLQYDATTRCLIGWTDSGCTGRAKFRECERRDILCRGQHSEGHTVIRIGRRTFYAFALGRLWSGRPGDHHGDAGDESVDPSNEGFGEYKIQTVHMHKMLQGKLMVDRPATLANTSLQKKAIGLYTARHETSRNHCCGAPQEHLHLGECIGAKIRVGSVTGNSIGATEGREFPKQDKPVKAQAKFSSWNQSYGLCLAVFQSTDCSGEPKNIFCHRGYSCHYVQDQPLIWIGDTGFYAGGTKYLEWRHRIWAEEKPMLRKLWEGDDEYYNPHIHSPIPGAKDDLRGGWAS